jgi:hypothetical protein
VVDQIVIMVYDTGLPTPALYQRYVAYAAHFMNQTLGAHQQARVLLGVPTYDETGIMHRGGVETIDNGLMGVVHGLRGSGHGGTFEGVALYAEWTTEPSEWTAYEQIWRGRPSGELPPASGTSGGLQIAR